MTSRSRLGMGWAVALASTSFAGTLAFAGCDDSAISNPLGIAADAAIDVATDAADAPLEDSTATPDTPADAPVDARPTALRVLFIGDSYTYVNDLPGMLSRIAATAGVPPTISTESIVKGGARLVDHWNNGVAQERIREGGFTHVVLQGQSEEPGLAYYGDLFMLYARHFGDLAVDAGAHPTLYVTWARAPGDAVYGPTGPRGLEFLTPDEMQDKLTWSYATVARDWRTSILACVGEAFRQSLQRYPEIVLHQNDKSHPTVAGTYLAASTFYVALTGSPVPAASEIPAGVDARDAARLRDVATLGSACATPHVQSEVTLYDLGANGYTWNSDGPDGGPPFDFGTAGTPIAHVFYLANLGDAGVDVRDAEVTPPFAWTTGAFPGGTGSTGDTSFCSAFLAPQATCALSVSYGAGGTGLGKISLDLGGTYLPTASRTLSGTSTSRALLTVSPYPGVAPPPTSDGSYHVVAGLGETRPFTLFVANRGGAAATAITVGTPLDAPFSWGPAGSGAFPGGTGTTSIRGVSYDYCTGTLSPGSVCVITANFAPTTAMQSLTSSIDLAYEDALGPIAGHATLPLN